MKVDYLDISRSYDKHRSYTETQIKEIIDFAGIQSGDRILDLGCGTGNITRGILEHINVDAVGLDISVPMLRSAREKSQEVVCADAAKYNLPFRDNTLDAVVGGYVLHQIGSLDSLFPECYRVLRRGSVTFFTSSHRQIENHDPIIKRFFPSSTVIDKARFPDTPEIARRLVAAGFRGIREHEVAVRKMPIDEKYLEKIKGKYISTYQLLPEKEFEAGVAGLEKYIRSRRQPEYREWRGTLIGGRKNE